MRLTAERGEPFLNLWFGNFYQPAYDDERFTEEALALAQRLGFNSICLDSKAQQDFADRYRGGPPSPYVKMQEHMMARMEELGLRHTFLALYLNGDNLYPNIRFSPPIYGESVVNPDGSDGRWYRYWSEKARGSMEEHVKELFEMYSRNHAVLYGDGKEYLPLCSMWDPVAAPSFDEDGRKRYKNWLEREYGGDIGAFNRACGTAASSFAELRPEDYWYGRRFGPGVYRREDRERRTPAYRVWRDNKKWQRFELTEYFRAMQKRLKRLDPRFYLSPCMTQWGYFLNVDGSRLASVGFSELWDTAMRGIDCYELAPYVDSCNFIAVPVTPEGAPDAYAVSCQHAMMRGMNDGRGFLGGVYFGRFLYGDVYEFVSPAETVASIAASGAMGYWAYGMCGLDDGGVLHRMDAGFQDSLAAGNRWAKQVIPLLRGERKKDVALLFPSAMAAYEPFAVEGNADRRRDLAGWFRSCCDAGYQPDIIGIPQILAGALERYAALLLLADSCYADDRSPELEKTLRAWVRAGGCLLHGPRSALAQAVTGRRGTPHARDCIRFRDGGIPQGDDFESFEGDETLAVYASDGKGCVTRSAFGKGRVYSFGFAYGTSYAAKIAPHVPLSQKNREFYPVPLMREDPAHAVLRGIVPPTAPFFAKNVETAVFSDGTVIVNHSSFPVRISLAGEKIFQYPVDGSLLLPRSAVFVRAEDGRAASPAQEEPQCRF